MKAETNIDLYYAGQAIESEDVRELMRNLERRSYRKLATFPGNLEKLRTVDIPKIALVNYLTDRLTQRQFRQEVEEAIAGGASEIELYWVESFLSWGKDKWREFIEEFANEGVILRVMLDIAPFEDEQLVTLLGFLRDLGVTDLGISSGINKDITTLAQWKEKQRLFPTIFRTKIVGIKSQEDADAFLATGVRFVGTRDLS